MITHPERPVAPPGDYRGGFLVKGIPPDGFQDRLALAERCIGETLPEAGSRDGERHVRLGQSVAWASDRGWILPPELLAIVGDKPASAPTSDKPALPAPHRAPDLE